VTVEAGKRRVTAGAPQRLSLWVELERSLAGSVTSCVFCGYAFAGRRVRTSSPILPHWVIGALPDRRGAGHPLGADRPALRPEVLWRTADPGRATGSICQGCRDGWVHEAEEGARPLIIPLIEQPRGALDNRPQAVALIARWALTVLVALHDTHARSGRLVSDVDLRALRAAGVMPATVRLLMGANAAGQGTWAQGQALSPAGDGTAPALTATLMIGHLVLFAISTPTASPGARGLDGRLANAMIPIWPPSTRTWPPRMLLRRDDIPRLADATTNILMDLGQA
jgi:hypothetical protein